MTVQMAARVQARMGVTIQPAKPLWRAMPNQTVLSQAGADWRERPVSVFRLPAESR